MNQPNKKIESWEVPHSTSLKISIFRPFWAYLGQNLTFLGPLRPSEAVCDVIFVLFGHVGCSKHLKNVVWTVRNFKFESNFGKKKIEKNSKNLGVEKSSKKLFLLSNLKFRSYSWSSVSNTKSLKGVCRPEDVKIDDILSFFKKFLKFGLFWP